MTFLLKNEENYSRTLNNKKYHLFNETPVINLNTCMRDFTSYMEFIKSTEFEIYFCLKYRKGCQDVREKHFVGFLRWQEFSVVQWIGHKVQRHEC